MDARSAPGPPALNTHTLQRFAPLDVLHRQGQLREVQRQLTDARSELRAALLAAEEASAEAAARTADAVNAGSLAASAEQAAERAAAREAEAAAAAHAAEVARQAMLEEMGSVREALREAEVRAGHVLGRAVRVWVRTDPPAFTLSQCVAWCWRLPLTPQKLAHGS